MPKVEIAGPTSGAAAEESEPPRGIVLDIVEEAGGWASAGDVAVLLAPLLLAIGRNCALRSQLPAEACLALADDAAVRKLNATYRAKDKATNILSFPSGMPGEAGQPRQLGDIILGFETIAAEAVEQGVPLADHIRHLALHGLLHLMGYDHEADATAEAMEALEIEILAEIGVANPYGEDAPVIVSGAFQ